MITLRSIASEIACRSRWSFTGSLASWKIQRCASTAGTSKTFTPRLPLSVSTRSGVTRSITWISPARSAGGAGGQLRDEPEGDLLDLAAGPGFQ